MTNEKPTGLKAEADKVYKILAKKNPSVEEVKKITYMYLETLHIKTAHQSRTTRNK